MHYICSLIIFKHYKHSPSLTVSDSEIISSASFLEIWSTCQEQYKKENRNGKTQ